MRAPSDLPRRPPRQRSGRGRVVLVVGIVVLFLLLTSLRGIAGFYTDYLWFDSLGFRGVFTGVLGAKVSLPVLFSAIFFVILWANLFIGDRLAPRFRPAGPEEEVIERYHAVLRDIRERHSQGTVVVLSHGAAIRLVTPTLVPNVPLASAAHAQLPNTGRVVLDGDRESPTGWRCLEWTGLTLD